jgi:hypothetical protein
MTTETTAATLPTKLPAWMSWLWLIVLVLAIFVRLWKIEYTPLPNDADEMAYILAGQSFLEYGRPISWSTLSHDHVVWENIAFRTPTVSVPSQFGVYDPWFDHLFFVPVLMGGWSELAGYHFPSLPPALWYRLPMLAIAGLNLYLLFYLARKLFGYWPALFMLTIFSFSPALIIVQRMVVSENFIAMFLLLGLYFYFEKKSWLWLSLATISAAIVKPTSAIVLPILLFGLWREKRYKEAIVYVIASLAGIGLLYFLYGAGVNWGQFVSGMTHQSNRLIGWTNPAFILANPGFYTEPMYDLSYFLMLFLGLGIFLKKPVRGSRVLQFGIIAGMCTIWATSAEHDVLGWYRVPLFFMLGIAGASAVTLDSVFFIAIFLGVLIVNNLGLVRYPTHPLPDTLVLRMGVGLVLSYVTALIYFRPKPRVLIATICCLLMLYAGYSFYLVNNYFAANCRDKTCPTPLVTERNFWKVGFLK